MDIWNLSRRHRNRQRSADPRRPTAGENGLVKTYGCQMNVYDSQRMADALAAEGYVVDRRR